MSGVACEPPSDEVRRFDWIALTTYARGSGSAAAGALDLEKNTDFDVLVSLSLAVLSLSLLLTLLADFFLLQSTSK